MENMKLSYEQWCRIQEILANLKCPNCFSTKVKLCEEENKENALCTECDCKFEFNPELAGRWD
jgi:Zn-dependent alcohol dehydrogenase